MGPRVSEPCPLPVTAAAVLDHIMGSPVRLSLLCVVLASLVLPGRGGKCSGPSQCGAPQEEGVRVGG